MCIMSIRFCSYDGLYTPAKEDEMTCNDQKSFPILNLRSLQGVRESNEHGDLVKKRKEQRYQSTSQTLLLHGIPVQNKNPIDLIALDVRQNRTGLTTPSTFSTEKCKRKMIRLPFVRQYFDLWRIIVPNVQLGDLITEIIYFENTAYAKTAYTNAMYIRY